jgi:hypothetical protein
MKDPKVKVKYKRGAKITKVVTKGVNEQGKKFRTVQKQVSRAADAGRGMALETGYVTEKTRTRGNGLVKSGYTNIGGLTSGAKISSYEHGVKTPANFRPVSKTSDTASYKSAKKMQKTFKKGDASLIGNLRKEAEKKRQSMQYK